jgi:hypothetical protein
VGVAAGRRPGGAVGRGPRGHAAADTLRLLVVDSRPRGQLVGDAAQAWIGSYRRDRYEGVVALATLLDDGLVTGVWERSTRRGGQGTRLRAAPAARGGGHKGGEFFTADASLRRWPEGTCPARSSPWGVEQPTPMVRFVGVMQRRGRGFGRTYSRASFGGNLSGPGYRSGTVAFRRESAMGLAPAAYVDLACNGPAVPSFHSVTWAFTGPFPELP